MTIFNPDTIDKAADVSEEFRLRTLAYESAYRDWKVRPTLSNALRRDGTRARMNDLSDAADLARAILNESRASCGCVQGTILCPH